MTWDKSGTLYGYNTQTLKCPKGYGYLDVNYIDYTSAAYLASGSTTTTSSTSTSASSDSTTGTGASNTGTSATNTDTGSNTGTTNQDGTTTTGTQDAAVNTTTSTTTPPTPPKDFYFVYIPQKSGDTWNYKDRICQSNSTMCPKVEYSGEGGAIAGAVIGGCFVLCILGFGYKTFCKANAVQEEEEVEVTPGKVEEVMVNPGSTVESQTITNTTSTQMVQQMGPPAAGVFMPPPPPMMGQPMGMQQQPMGMMQPGYGQQMQ